MTLRRRLLVACAVGTAVTSLGLAMTPGWQFLSQFIGQAQQAGAMAFPQLSATVTFEPLDSTVTLPSTVDCRVLTAEGVIEGEGSINPDGTITLQMSIPADVAVDVSVVPFTLKSQIAGSLEVWESTKMPAALMRDYFSTDPSGPMAAHFKLTLDQSDADPHSYLGSVVGAMSCPSYYGTLAISASDAGSVEIAVTDFSSLPESFLAYRALSFGVREQVQAPSSVDIYRWSIAGGASVFAVDSDENQVASSVLRRQGSAVLQPLDHHSLTVSVSSSSFPTANWVAVFSQSVPVLPLDPLGSAQNRIDEGLALEAALCRTRVVNGSSEFFVPEGPVRVELWGFDTGASGGPLVTRLGTQNATITSDSSLSF